MTTRVRSRRPVPRAVGGLVAALLVGVCAVVYPGDRAASLAPLGTLATSGTPDRPVGTGAGPGGHAPVAAPALPGAANDDPDPAASRSEPVLAAVPGLADGPACPVRGPGWLLAENSRPGDVLELPDGEPSAGSVVGYPDRASAVCGEVVTVQLSGPRSAVQLVGYRIGDYAGAGARVVWRSGPVRVSRQPVPSGARYPHLVEPQWPLSVTVPVDGRWTPGLYLLVPVGLPGTTDAGRPAGPAIPLTVRDDDGPAPILFKASTLTWQAYNDWAGWSLYHGPVGSGAAATAGRARVVSLHRPLIGPGYRQLQFMDLPVVRQLERLGLDVAYTTDEDVAAAPDRLLGHAEIVSGGHSEYWTRSMYDGLLRAADAGVNLVFLGANNLWWQARLETSPASTRPDRMVVHRVLADDPVAATDPSSATVLWGPPPLNRDPAAVLGQSHAAIGAHGGLQVLDAPDWFLAGSGLTTGSVLVGAVGNEAAGYNPHAANPTDTQVLLAGVLRGRNGSVVVSADYSVRPSGAAVFAAGTTDWACVPAGECIDGVPPAATAAAIGVLTRNVLRTLSRPRAGLTHPPRPVLPFVASQLLPRLAPAAIGSYGSPTEEGES